MTVCFCTLALHAPYRQRARLLCADTAPAPFVVLTDEPGDFADLPVRVLRHAPTGPMAKDYLERPGLAGPGGGGSAYHDKRFVLRAALLEFDTAIFVDADSRIGAFPPLGVFPPGLAAGAGPSESIATHLQTSGPGRLPFFEELACRLTGSAQVLATAVWCYETCYAVTRDGGESSFFAAWDLGAEFLRGRGVHSGEGGVMGLAAACAGWSVDFGPLAGLAPHIRHEGGGPKET